MWLIGIPKQTLRKDFFLYNYDWRYLKKKAQIIVKKASPNIFQNQSLQNRKRIYKTYDVLKLKIALFI